MEPAQQLTVLDVIFADGVYFGLLSTISHELLRPNRRGEPVGEALKAQASARLLARALQDAGPFSLVATHPATVPLLFKIWANVRGRASLNSYLRQHLCDEASLLQLIQSFVPLTHSSARLGPYRSNLTQDGFNFMQSLFDPAPFIELLSPIHRAATPDFPSAGYREPATHSMLLSQFAYWCQHSLPAEN